MAKKVTPTKGKKNKQKRKRKREPAEMKENEGENMKREKKFMSVKEIFKTTRKESFRRGGAISPVFPVLWRIETNSHQNDEGSLFRRHENAKSILLEALSRQHDKVHS